MYVVIFLLSVITANIILSLLTPSVGLWASVVTAFLFIGINISIRDKIHEDWYKHNLRLKMSILIIVGSVLTYIINPSSKSVAMASGVSFLVSGIVDFIIYQLLYHTDKSIKVNVSNIGSSIVDSILFPTLAFGNFNVLVILGQFLVKVFGGYVWSLFLFKR